MVFSGSGRHRRPTQADRAVAAAGVASVGLALPLLTAAGAHAAPVKTWDAVAQCETGGNWSSDDGNGHYGGLGLTQRTWVAYGGDKLAAEPDHATKNQQITVAERVLADSGPGTWSKCAEEVGLTGGTPATKTTPTPAPSATPTSTPSATPTPVPSTTPASPTATPTPSAPAADSSSPAPGTPAPPFPGRAGYDPANGVYWYQDGGVWHWTIQHDVYIQHMNATAPSSAPSATPGTGTGTGAVTPGPTDPAAPQTSQSPQSDSPTTGASTPAPSAPGTPATGSATATPQVPGTPAASADGTTSPLTPGSTGAPAAPAAPTSPAAVPQTYTVEHGDTLSAIAQAHQLTGWQNLYEDNKGTIGSNPDLILPGQALHLQQH
ncbi:transglycosylase family protein [Kitasatospora sp. NPDC056138]|uniref:transglycosylase family protein n=1 Tax=Kitasatospora sp. NPDC056138 TaxID=3345724 RepID=UPI0035DA7028